MFTGICGALLFIGVNGDSDFPLSFTPNGLTSGGWANEGTLGSDYDISSLNPGTVQTVDFNGEDINAVCFENSEEVATMDFDMNQPEISITAWVRTDYLHDYTFLLTSGDEDGGWERGFFFQTNNDCSGGIAVGGTGSCYTSTLGHPPIGEWIYVAATWSVANNEAVIYLNGGDLAGGQQQTRDYVRSPTSSHTDTGINRSWYTYEDEDYDPLGWSFNGCFARIRAAYRVLSAGEVASDYDDSVPPIDLLPSASSTAPPVLPSASSTAPPTVTCCECPIPEDPKSYHWVAAGNPFNSRWKGIPTIECVEDSNTEASDGTDDFGAEIAVSCCSEDGSSGERYFPDCERAKTYDEAQALCDGLDGDYRLCTLTEMLDKITQGTGCQNDGRYNWVSTECASFTLESVDVDASSAATIHDAAPVEEVGGTGSAADTAEGVPDLMIGLMIGAVSAAVIIFAVLKVRGVRAAKGAEIKTARDTHVAAMSGSEASMTTVAATEPNV